MIERTPDWSRALYKIDTENKIGTTILIKHSSAPRKDKDSLYFTWDFNGLVYVENHYFCFVCMEKKSTDAKVREICCIPPSKVKALFVKEEIDSKTQISCRVKLEKGKSFRVSRKQKNIGITISRKEIEKI